MEADDALQYALEQVRAQQVGVTYYHRLSHDSLLHQRLFVGQGGGLPAPAKSDTV